ncbi:PH domain-containing protein [Jiangella endophytica]|uniref:PH domain-containing protein n=1 Tax=Jiangella endophytica TaxID=1623398 RepID=UPI0018E4EC7A|nr:PH domain-containing protein [Jiangella endophytica]
MSDTGPADPAFDHAAAAPAPDSVATTTPTAGDEPGWLALHRDTVKVTGVWVFILALGGAIPTTIGIGSGTSYGTALAWVVPAVVLVVLVSAIADYVRWRHSRYRVTPTRMEQHKGMVFTTKRSLGRERIRTVDLSADPVQRVFGLVKVSIGTGEQVEAGGPGQSPQTIVLDPVHRDEGERLRALLLDRAPVAADGTEPDVRVLARWDPGWLRFAPLSFWTLALAGIAVGGLFQVLNWFGRESLPIDTTRDIVEDIGATQTLVLFAVVFVLVGAVATLALTLEAWWAYRLEREPGGTLRVRRGLLTTRSVSIEEQRVRGVEIVEPLGVRSAGAARVDVVTTGLRTDPKSEASTLLPAAPMTVAASVAAAVAGVRPGGRLRRHPVAARTRRLRWALAADVVLAAAVVWLTVASPVRDFWAVVLTVLAAACCVALVLLAGDAYRSLGHDLDGDYLVARKGSLRRATVYLQRNGIIGWRLSQSVFQRRAGLLTLTATTAAGARRYSVVDADEHEVLDFGAEAVPGLLDPFLVRDAPVAAEPEQAAFRER